MGIKNYLFEICISLTPYIRFHIFQKLSYCLFFLLIIEFKMNIFISYIFSKYICIIYVLFFHFMMSFNEHKFLMLL